MSANERPDSAESGAGLPPRHGGYKGTPGYDGPWPPVAPKGPGGGSPGTADCGLRVDKVMMHHIASSANVTQAAAERVVSALFAELGCVTTPGGPTNV